MEKRKSLSPDKMLFPAQHACSLKCKGRKTSGCISGRLHSTSRRAFCKGVQPHHPPEESPVEQDISRTGISHTTCVEWCLKFPGNGAVRTEYDYSGVPFLWFVAQGGASLSLGKQRNEQKYVRLASITLSKLCRCLMLHISSPE